MYGPHLSALHRLLVAFSKAYFDECRRSVPSEGLARWQAASRQGHHCSALYRCARAGRRGAASAAGTQAGGGAASCGGV